MFLTPSAFVLKFGGSSVGSPQRFRALVEIVRRYRRMDRRVVLVVSALGGVTDLLVDACESNRDPVTINALVGRLFARHRLHAADVLSLRSQRRFVVILQKYLVELRSLLGQENDYSGLQPFARDAVLATGERLAVYTMALALSDVGIRSCPKDAAELILTDDVFGEAKVDLDATARRIRSWYERLPAGAVPVVTGFIGATADGRTTTLGRGGSDYSASLVATAVRAERLERWTDVNGVYTSDPKEDPGARRLEQIVMSDALAWNRAGKMGIHRKALDPLLEASIPMYVRSVDAPDDPGTAILPPCIEIEDYRLKIEDYCLQSLSRVA